MSTHAQLSPSSADRWMVCPGSVALNAGLPDTSSAAADEGTAAHWLGEQILNGADGTTLVGAKAENGVTVTADMLTDVLKYTSYVQDVVKATGGTLLVEQRLPIGHLTGEDGAHGTSDTVILAGHELIVIDLKFGQGVRVDAERNRQLRIYALGALEQYGLAFDFTQVRMVIHQPRLDHVSEWVDTGEELEAFADDVRAAAMNCGIPTPPLVPTTKGCRWCKAKADCPALRDVVMDQFENIEPETATADQLGEAMGKTELIEGWIKAIRGKVESNLFAGIPVVGFKLVQGKRGNRAWADEAEAEATLKAMRVKHDLMYSYKLISPTTADKLAKSKDIGPRQWPKVLALITQSDGKPSVAPEDDKRPALILDVAAQFDDLT
jgi:hypothetical protein